MVVSERQANIHAAVAFALDRAERAVQRRLKSAGKGRGMAAARSVE
jgi:hypothetical protein